MTLAKTTKYLNAATFGVLLLADAALPAWALTISRQEEVFQGIARDRRGEIVYVEEHRMIYEDGRPHRDEVRYRDAAGQEIAVLNASFADHLYLPNYAFEDRRSGRQAGTFVDGSWVKAYGRVDRHAPVQQAMVPLAEDLITGQGLQVYLRDHLAELSEGDAATPVRFLMPLEGRDFTFHIHRLDTPDEPGTVAFAIEVENGLLQPSSPRPELRYERETGRLLSYRGVSNLLDADQGVQNVAIDYRYSS